MKFKPVRTLRPDQLKNLTQEVEEMYRELEVELIKLIVRRVSEKGFDLDQDNVLRWQLERLSQINGLNGDVIRVISEQTGKSRQLIIETLQGVGARSIESVDREAETVLELGKDSAPPPSNELTQRINSYINATFRNFDNFINESLITTNLGEGTVAKAYKKILTDVTTQVIAGNRTVEQAVRQSIRELVERGVETSFVDKGGKTWSVERYARTTIRSTTNRAYNELRTERLKDYGTTLVRVSELPDPRKACSKIQGKVVTMLRPEENNTNYPSIYEFGYGEPWGVRGVNCRHMLFPFFEGVNILPDPKYSEDEMEENRSVSQRQARIEASIRRAKEEAEVFKASGDVEMVRKANQKVRDRQAAMRSFIDETGRTRRRHREQLYSARYRNR